jgi:hypothetical protein
LTKVYWRNFNVKNAKLNSEYICKEIVKNETILFRAKNKIELDSIVKQDIPNIIAIQINPKWSERKTNSIITKAYIKHQIKEQCLEDKTYFSFTIPIFSEDKKYFRITILEGKAYKISATTFIYKIENKKITLVYEYGRWATVSHI